MRKLIAKTILLLFSGAVLGLIIASIDDYKTFLQGFFSSIVIMGVLWAINELCE